MKFHNKFNYVLISENPARVNFVNFVFASSSHSHRHVHNNGTTWCDASETIRLNHFTKKIFVFLVNSKFLAFDEFLMVEMNASECRRRVSKTKFYN